MDTNYKKTFKFETKSLKKISESKQLKDLKFSTAEETFKINENEVLIKTHSCPINPLDILKLNNVVKMNGLVLGSECSGEIIESQDKSLIGKKVSTGLMMGAYQSYHVVDKSMLLIHEEENVDLTSVSSMFINPLTRIGLVSLVDVNKKQSVINLASNSALGKMIARTCIQKNIEVINVVRTEKKKIELEKEEKGLKYVLAMDETHFFSKLSNLAKELNALICFDPIGGEFTGHILKILPYGSRLYVYGSLSEKPIADVDGADLRNNDKGILGFALSQWWQRKLTKEEQREHLLYISKNKNLFVTTIKKVFDIEQYTEAFEEYMKDMSAGKILLRFNK